MEDSPVLAIGTDSLVEISQCGMMPCLPCSPGIVERTHPPEESRMVRCTYHFDACSEYSRLSHRFEGHFIRAHLHLDHSVSPSSLATQRVLDVSERAEGLPACERSSGGVVDSGLVVRIAHSRYSSR